MQLYTLNLAQSLRWDDQETSGWTQALNDVNPAADGDERVAFWHPVDIIGESADGPRCIAQLPVPFRCGKKAAEDSGSIVLEATRYLFTQASLEGEASVREAIEWFAREAWWTEAKLTGPIIVRLVREDGKTALQVLRELG